MTRPIKTDKGIFEIIRNQPTDLVPDKELEKWLAVCTPVGSLPKFESGYPLACTHSYPDLCDECRDKIIEWGKEQK